MSKHLADFIAPIPVESVIVREKRKALPLHVGKSEGCKEWRVYGPAPEASEPILEHTLVEGEYLFLPAGYYHECDTPSGTSLHLGLGFSPRDYSTFL